MPQAGLLAMVTGSGGGGGGGGGSSGGFLLNALIGAVAGRETAKKQGGDPKKGAAYGGVAGGVGGIRGGVGGAVAGGVMAGAMAVPAPKIPISSRGPAPKTVLAGERAQATADQLKKRRRHKTAMTRDYGDLSLGTPGLLGVT